MSQIATKRLQRELSELQKNPPANIRLVEADQLNKWIVEFTGAEGSLYAGEHFLLQFKFPSDYPIDSPEVIFLKPNIPVHPHVYTNGHICLSILYDHWTPALTTSSVCLSLQSMLSSCQKKEHPTDNDRYVGRVGDRASPKDSKWIFHDPDV